MSDKASYIEASLLKTVKVEYNRLVVGRCVYTCEDISIKKEIKYTSKYTKTSIQISLYVKEKFSIMLKSTNIIIISMKF